MSFTPNRIALITRGRYDEAQSASSPSGIYPGMLLQVTSTLANGNPEVEPHQTSGGAEVGPLTVALEDALEAGDATQEIIGPVIPIIKPAKGDRLLMLLAAGQNVAVGAALMSNGDGTLTAQTSTNPIIAYAAEAINNSSNAGSSPMSAFNSSETAFIRVDIP